VQVERVTALHGLGDPERFAAALRQARDEIDPEAAPRSGRRARPGRGRRGRRRRPARRRRAAGAPGPGPGAPGGRLGRGRVRRDPRRLRRRAPPAAPPLVLRHQLLAAIPYRHGTQRCQKPRDRTGTSFWQRSHTAMALSAARNPGPGPGTPATLRGAALSGSRRGTRDGSPCGSIGAGRSAPAGGGWPHVRS
jgi:hypothetical protein